MSCSWSQKWSRVRCSWGFFLNHLWFSVKYFVRALLFMNGCTTLGWILSRWLCMHLVLMAEAFFHNSVEGILRAYNITKINNYIKHLQNATLYICSKEVFFYNWNLKLMQKPCWCVIHLKYLNTFQSQILTLLNSSNSGWGRVLGVISAL